MAAPVGGGRRLAVDEVTLRVRAFVVELPLRLIIDLDLVVVADGTLEGLDEAQSCRGDRAQLSEGRLASRAWPAQLLKSVHARSQQSR